MKIEVANGEIIDKHTILVIKSERISDAGKLADIHREMQALADGVKFVVVAGASSGMQLDMIGPRIAELLDGRGGGRGEIFQGKAKELENREAALELLRRG